MEKCRVCYQEISKEHVESHIPICDEIEKSKKELGFIVEKMTEYLRQAYLMQSSHTTNANLQQYLPKSFLFPHFSIESSIKNKALEEVLLSPLILIPQ